jgi:hypothetical protein
MSNPGRDPSLLFTIEDPRVRREARAGDLDAFFEDRSETKMLMPVTVELQKSAHWWILRMWTSKFCIWTEFRFRRGGRNCRLSPGDCFVMR